MKYPAVAFIVLLMACQNGGGSDSHPADSPATVAAAPAPKAPDTTTLGGRWYLQPVLPSDTATGKTPWLELSPDHSSFSGNTGCNMMHGKFYFSKTDSSLSFNDKIGTAKMNCPGYNEAGFLKSLKNTGHYRLHDGVLTLMGDDRVELSHWTRKPGAAPKSLKA